MEFLFGGATFLWVEKSVSRLSRRRVGYMNGIITERPERILYPRAEAFTLTIIARALAVDALQKIPLINLSVWVSIRFKVDILVNHRTLFRSLNFLILIM